MYTAGGETDEKLKDYRDYIKHTTAAANCLPNYVGRMPWACAVGLRPQALGPRPRPWALLWSIGRRHGQLPSYVSRNVSANVEACLHTHAC